MKRNLPLIPTNSTAIALITLVILGSWQVQRLVWKNHLIAEISEKIQMPPIALKDGQIDIDNLKYRKVTVKGRFLHENEVHLFTGAREMRGEPGYNIFTPLELKNGTVILVDRGWVPAKQKEREKRPETLVKGTISITGMLHSGEHQGIFTPENEPDKNLWFWIDIPTVAGFTGKAIENVYVRALAGEGETNSLPIPGKRMIEIRNDHLQYAIIWYSLAVILLVVYVIYVRKNQSLEGNG